MLFVSEDDSNVTTQHAAGCACSHCQSHNANTEDNAATGGANIFGTKWGADGTLGTAGGVVTWSMPPAGSDISAFFDGVATSSVNPNGTFIFDFEAAIRRAFNAWSEIANIEFIQVDEPADAPFFDEADIRLHFAPIEGNVLGRAFFPGDQEFPGIGGDILLDTDPNLNFNQQDFDALVLHEIGHALGLGHVDQNVDSVMTPFLSATTLRAVDIDGAQQIYGVQDNAPVVYQMRAIQDHVTLVDIDSPNNLTVIGNTFDNRITTTSQSEWVEGAFGDDTLSGLAGNDTLLGEEGNDILYGGDGRDRLSGGKDDDELNGEEGNDRLLGGSGNDLLSGGIGSDILQSGSGDDTLRGDGGGDFLRGGSGADELRGGVGGDSILGGSGQDLLRASAGRDTLNGGNQDDSVFGGSGNDVVNGGRGNDRVSGQSGNDTLDGGTENDILVGGKGSDFFVFSQNHGIDRVTDFDANDDDEQIDLSQLDGFDTFQDVQQVAVQVGSEVQIDTGDGNLIRLQNVNLNDLDASDFIL